MGKEADDESSQIDKDDKKYLPLNRTLIKIYLL